ncbi:MAG: cysteine--1-D-myo-inosityl 2-amino-2-deoxy-alpha-D-glucopyranoside ligase [Propionibacteriaceae bacterium]|nr:cysteine--1-D-myo-inosityl 2-amino-2-deoxy-alpha-D-glucopyranoside ligase [Propionibacteriaceae bacterium]
MYSWISPDVPLVPATSGDAPSTVSVFDTATQRLVEVHPKDGVARLYVCGITPYDATHLGHANTYVAFDLLNRVWRDLGLEVNYTQNVTDIDDPLLERAQATGQDWEELAHSQIELFRSDMEALRVIAPQHYIGAVECIACVIELIGRLRDTELVYQIEDAEHPDWYFHVAAAPGFGALSRLDQDEAIAIFAERGGDPQRPGKKHPLDCLLWRYERTGEPAWESVLGPGRPGWHIECTAIALKHLGAHFDVQGGGSDLVFPHHEMCAAQATAVTGQPLASACVHSGMVALDGEKMSKSKGNLELVSRLRQRGADPMAIRLAIMAHHYRSDWEWHPSDLTAAEERLRLWRGIRNNPAALNADESIAELRRAMRTDLDAPKAIAIVDAWAAASLAIDGDDPEAIDAMFTAVDALLGVRV